VNRTHRLESAPTTLADVLSALLEFAAAVVHVAVAYAHQILRVVDAVVQAEWIAQPIVDLEDRTVAAGVLN